MNLSDDEKNTLINVKIERANETIREVPYLIEQGFYRTAVNRLYYSCYYIVSALLLQRGYTSHTHKGVITLFAINFVKSGIVNNEGGQLYRSLFELRQTGDYDEAKIIDREDVISRLLPAERFIAEIEKLIHHEPHHL